MPSLSEKLLPRCVLCAMDCPIGAERDRLGRVSTLLPQDLGVSQGACVLGITAGWLITAENRILRARVKGQRADLDVALRIASDRLSAAPGRVAILFDVNRPLEGIAAAAGLRDRVLRGARLSATIPPQDGPIAETGVGGCPPFAEILKCDLVLAIGDVCSAQPALAKALRDMQRAGRRNQLISVDTAEGRASKTANDAIFVRPDAMAAFVCALAVARGSEAVRKALGGMDVGEICRRAGLEQARVERLAQAIRGSKSLGVVVSHTLGRYSFGTAAVAAAHALAQASGGKLWPLPTCTASAVLPALAERLRLEDMGSVLGAIEGGEVETLLVVGFDPDSVLPRSVWSRWGKMCGTVIWAGSLESDFGEQADIVLPLALAWEESGHKASPPGELEESACWTAPPSGVVTAQQLMARLGGTSADLSGLSAPPATGIKLEAFVTKAVPDAAGPGKGEVWLVGAPETHGYTGGLSCLSVSWQQRMASQEKVCLSPALAAEVGVEGAGVVKLSAAAPEGGDSHTSFSFRVAKERFYRQEKVVTAPAHWKALRELLAWRLDGKWAPQAAPVIVRVGRGD